MPHNNSLRKSVRSLAEARNFSFSLCVQTSSEAHPASYPMGIEGPFPVVKRGRGVTLTTHPHLVPRSRIGRSYISSPPSRLHGGSGTALLYFYWARNWDTFRAICRLTRGSARSLRYYFVVSLLIIFLCFISEVMVYPLL
jgi:hypothetical protein